MRLRNYILSSIAFLLVFHLGAQTKVAVKRADKDYDKFSYVKTSDILLKVAEKGYESADLFEKLGNSFYFNNKMEEAAKWYGKLVQTGKMIDSEYYFRYAQALKTLEKYDEADKWMQKFADENTKDLRSQSFTSKTNYLTHIEAISDSYEVINMDFNSEVSDFGANQYQDQFIFASTRKKGRNYKWNNQPYLDLYSVTKQEDGNYTNATAFSKDINTKMHESTVSFTSDDKVMYFTRNNYVNRVKRDKEGINRLQIFRAFKKSDGSWGDVESLSINSDDYSVAHPTINAAGTKMYFASDMPGTIGGSDIFVVDIYEDGSLGTPENLGNLINTQGSESFPYINSQGDLYYSSNGLIGLGGLDVFVVRDFEKKYASNKNLIVSNVGKPINSSSDDFGYYENLGTMEGFFSSNRPGGKGDDDIYGFEIPECIQNLKGQITDKDTQETLTNAVVMLFDASGKKVTETTTDAQGNYDFSELACDSQYLVRAGAKDYISNEKRKQTTRYRKTTLELNISLEKDKIAIGEGTNLREALKLNPIYFDFDKSDIRPDAEIELQKVIEVLKQYPNLKIDVRSHTDSRAPKAYNDALSNRRNEATKAYIINKGGIDASRISGKGYGESQLINKCSDGVPCSNAEHQLNRRSDFIVITN